MLNDKEVISDTFLSFFFVFVTTLFWCLLVRPPQWWWSVVVVTPPSPCLECDTLDTSDIVAGDMTAESDEKVEIIKTENIVTVTMDAAEEIQEDNAAEAQDYFKENYSSELAQVEAFLDENPDFFKDYLIRKASRHMIDSWLVAHSLPPGHCLPISPKSGSSTPHTR